jgi:3-deoxy-D-manno-octulosonate 8-phosphate phosphatase KdsC-like HAD superfamily phosphatase
MGIAVQDFFGFGDSCNDLCYLSACGIAGSPSNCIKSVASVVEFVSNHEDIEGFLAFLNRDR